MSDIENRGKSQPVIDIDSLQLDDNELDIDPGADPDVRLVPPEGKYVAKLAVNESNGSGITMGTDRRGRSFLGLHLAAALIADSKWDGAKVFDTRTTLVLDSSGTCGLMAIPRARKIKVPSNLKKTELVKLVKTDLTGEPPVGIEIRWESRYQDENGVWKTFRKGMRNYPERLDDNGNPTGQYVPEAEAPDGQVYPVRAVIVRYMPVEEVR